MSNEEIIATLNAPAAACAQKLLATFPDAILTSGRRDVVGQANAMASDVALDAQFIAKTYRKPLCPAAAACQDWVNAQAACLPKGAIADGLLATLKTFSDEELSRLSCHLGGDAFDVHPDGDVRKLQFLEDLASEIGAPALFLEKESGLTRWHFQFRSS